MSEIVNYGNKIPVDGRSFSGWVFKDGGKVCDGTAIRDDGVQRQADKGRCFTDSACGGIRNDLTVDDIMNTVHIHPALSEVIQRAAFRIK